MTYDWHDKLVTGWLIYQTCWLCASFARSGRSFDHALYNSIWLWLRPI